MGRYKEFVFLKNGKEIDWISPVEELIIDEDITKIKVFNGHYWYDASDCIDMPDDYILREVEEEGFDD